MSNNQKIKSFVNLTFILAILPAIAYLSAYIYEYIQCDYYNIPIYWISMDNVILLKFGMNIFIRALLFSVSISIFIFSIFTVGYIKSVKLQYAIFNIGFLTSAYFFLNFFDLLNLEFIITLSCILLLLNAYLIYEDYSERPIRENADNKKPEQSFKNSDIFIVVLCVLVPFFSIILGTNDAENRTYYGFILNRQPNQIILKKYGEYLITSTYNSKKNEISDTLSIFKLKDEQELKIVEKIIPPLKFKPHTAKKK